MVKRNKRQIKIFNILTDAVLIFVSYFIAVWLKFSVLNGVKSIDLTESRFIAGIAIISIILPICYYIHRTKNYTQVYVSIAGINAIGTLLLMVIFFIYKVNDFSRDVLLLFWMISSVLVILKHYTGRMIIRKSKRFGYAPRHVVVVGSGVHAQRYAADMESSKLIDCIIDGYFGSEQAEGLGTYFGTFDRLNEVIPDLNSDEIVVALEADETQYLQSAIDAADKEGIYLSMIPFYSDFIPSHPEIENIGRTKLINLRATPLDSFGNDLSKRITDIIGSTLIIIIISPLMLFTAIGVRLSSPGPIFFRQERVGKDKKPFMMLKFRSMRVNSEENTAWSTNEDPRKTKFGTFIRKYSIDELPQLFNVLFGDMSLVGPRPEIPFYVRQFKETIPLYLVRQQVRPGMTGWAQVHGLRGDTSIEDRVEYDIWYIENWSFWLDIKILFMTVFGGKFKNEEK